MCCRSVALSTDSTSLAVRLQDKSVIASAPHTDGCMVGSKEHPSLGSSQESMIPDLTAY